MDTDVKPQGHYLGEPVFCVSDTGKVTRTAISDLSIPRHSEKKFGEGGMSDFISIIDKMMDEEAYSLLNGHRGQHYFSLDEAIAGAIKVLEQYVTQTNITKDQERAARAYLASIQTEGGREEILKQSLVQVSQTVLLKDRTLDEAEIFPVGYFNPGMAVYGLVTPRTHYSLSPEWRPHVYFILMETVRKVSYAPVWPGKLHYGFTHTHYRFSPDTLCDSEHGARQKLRTLFEEQTGGSIDPQKFAVISADVEKKSHDDYMARLVKDMDRRVP